MTDKISSGVLYISYSGMLEPLGRSQVLAYLERLATKHQIHLVSFERAEDWARTEEREAIIRRIKAAGIHWHPLRYHKRPSAVATAWDIFAGSVAGLRLVRRYGLRIVHARSYVSSVMALLIKRLTGAKYVFDMRGFWADERVDGGLWPANGRMYRIAKWFERRFLLSADYVVSLTQAAVDEMRTFPYLQVHMPRFEVITTCTDLDLFKLPEGGSPVRTNDRHFTLGYVGSVGVWYMFDETLRAFQMLRERLPNSRLCIFNRGEHDYIRERIHFMNVDPKSVRIDSTDHTGIARAMGQMNAGIFFIKPAFSKVASAPTKLGEFLGCGVPCLSNCGVGDMATILEHERVGVALRRFDETTMREAIDRLLQVTQEPDIKLRCREVALKYFSLEDGVRAYGRIYNELLVESR